MGQFSWIYSDTNKQVVNNRVADTYLLVPEPFQGKYGRAIYESYYDGYGRFGRYDVYDLIVEWNKEIIPEIIEKIQVCEWECSVGEIELENLRKYFDGEDTSIPVRELGIILACYDEDNFRLKYPIKITSKEMDYALAKPSKRDPDQGWA